MPGSDAHTFPAAHALQLVTLLRRWDISAEELLDGLGLTEQGLEEPHARIPAELLRTLTARARELTGEPGIGFYLGLQKRISMYGYPGFAAMHAASVREGLELFLRYTPAITTGLGMELSIAGDEAVIRIEERVDLGDVRDVGVFSLLVGMRQITSALTGRTPGRVRMDVPFPEPDYFARFGHLLPDARFGQPQLRVVFPARALDVPLVTPDRAALQLAREACERELGELGFDRKLSARVERLLSTAQALPSVDVAARALALSTRTLKRKLAHEGLTFSALLDAERHARALRLLRTTELSLDELAERLGYATRPSFTRAFRRWTGQSPARHRRGSR